MQALDGLPLEPVMHEKYELSPFALRLQPPEMDPDEDSPEEEEMVAPFGPGPGDQASTLGPRVGHLEQKTAVTDDRILVLRHSVHKHAGWIQRHEVALVDLDARLKAAAKDVITEERIQRTALDALARELRAENLRLQEEVSDARSANKALSAKVAGLTKWTWVIWGGATVAIFAIEFFSRVFPILRAVVPVAH